MIIRTLHLDTISHGASLPVRPIHKSRIFPCMKTIHHFVLL
ncbi:hypothetical protein HMPREF1985_00060 [Mitsuokella sp. oral taxon 131 str. W9106]|nr:hypothetical protein HMPREF1985_00060 [Mitsuokella sp. oral taxon 131 str. W9106]